MALCPYHRDVKRSMHVGPSNGFYCYGCHVSGNLHELREQVANPHIYYEACKKEYKMTKAVTYENKADTYYLYTDKEGVPLYRVVRTPDKEFFQQRYTPEGWQWGVRGVQRVLYRLPDLANAAEGTRVYFVEGEKDADTLWKHQLVGTTLPMGAGKRFNLEIYEPLKGKRVVLIPDNDVPGFDHMFTCSVTS